MVEGENEAMRRHLRFMNARNNPVHTLVSLFIVAVLFIFFQGTIMKNLQRTQMMLLNSGSEQHNKGKYVHHIKHVAAPDISRINPKFAAKYKKEIGIKVNGTLLRGVKKDHRKYYVPNDEGRFTCLSGNETIEFHLVNNDYCDCSDGSDEPGTSACKNGRFYCEPELRYMTSSRVNDGICDCCDGSDEWKGVTLAPDLKLPVTDDVQRAPCSDTCLDYHHQQIHDENVKKEGILAKEEIVQKFKNQNIEEGKYGEENEFYYLSKECYVYKSPSYMYEICPYHNASQIGEETWLIGSGGELQGNFQLTMDNGASEHCPDGKPRKSILMFKCSPETTVKYVSEKSTCEYHVKFHTPAACVTSQQNADTPSEKDETPNEKDDTPNEKDDPSPDER